MEEPRCRAIIEDVNPSINGGEFAIKRVVGDKVKLTADVFADGHDIINAHLLYKHDSEKTWKKSPMSPVVNDLWEVEFEVKKLGFYTYRLDAWVDYALNWQHEIKRKIEDDQHVASELLDGVKYLKAVKAKKHQVYLKEAATAFEAKRSYKKAIKIAQSEELKAIFEEYPYQTFITASRDFRVKVDSKKAGFSTWYEFFPRSAGESATKHGTFKDAAKRLPYVAQMGFDVLYFPPIHPIGEKNRKGKNNATNAEPGDVGSPWAIGSKLGGHKDIHPDLGTMKDFKDLVKSAKDLGIDVAMDFALQCAPDHPYVTDSPQWFKWRPDGTVQYAENPPKKYQDIIPINFECEDWENLWEELKSIIFYWIDAGVRIFRVDNPHTKPYRFWKWLIAEVHKEYPEIIFLSEAFTRPKVMHQLAKVGFTHSYSYFTWRNSKRELEEYMDELVNTKSREYFRPNFWPNTPDILPYELQQPNEAAFIQRFFLAATLSGNYGMYGPAYENMFYQAVPGKEEYWDSEKYEIKKHIWDTRGKIKQVIRMVNDARKAHPALQDTLNYRKCDVDNDRVMAYYKGDQGANDHILCVVNMDTHYTQSGWVQVPLSYIGISPDDDYVVCDLITNESYNWQGEWNFIELNPHGLPFHFFKVVKR